jgi:hypothetical protein
MNDFKDRNLSIINGNKGSNICFQATKMNREAFRKENEYYKQQVKMRACENFHKNLQEYFVINNFDFIFDQTFSQKTNCL